jgi:hypothetical protein
MRNRINMWGLASVVLLVGNYLVGSYSFYQQGSGQVPLLSTVANHGLCVVMQLTAALCGIVAMRRGSPLWLFSVIPSAWLAFTCFLGEI